MLSQSDSKVIDLAYTHANSIKKKTALEEVFLSLYSKYKDGDTLSKIEYRTIKDYLALYRSELSSLKKKAKMKNAADVILDKQKVSEAKKAREKQQAQYEQALIDLEKYKNDLARLSDELEKERQKNISSNRFLINAYQRYVSYGYFGSFNEVADMLLTLFMVGLGGIPPNEADKFFDNFGTITTKNNKKCLRCSKKYDDAWISLLFVHFTANNSDKTDILPVVYVTEEDDRSLSKSVLTIISLTTVNADVAQALLDTRLQNTKKPEVYSGIDYSHESYRKSSLLLSTESTLKETYILQIQNQFSFENTKYVAFRR